MNDLFLTINSWLRSGSILAFPASFLWGIVSVSLSPCHIASIPLLVAYVAGQRQILPPRQAAKYAVVFVCGLFITIITIGFACAIVGRMLGDIGPGWQVVVGIVLLWAAWSLFRPPQCSATGGLLQKIRISGLGGAFVLGLSYGFLSGLCTFGFIAPILGFITIQASMITGIVMLILFGIGHCLPLVAAGIFSARLVDLLHSRILQSGLLRVRKIAGLIIAAIGCYFILITLLP